MAIEEANNALFRGVVIGRMDPEEEPYPGSPNIPLDRELEAEAEAQAQEAKEDEGHSQEEAAKVDDDLGWQRLMDGYEADARSSDYEDLQRFMDRDPSLPVEVVEDFILHDDRVLRGTLRELEALKMKIWSKRNRQTWWEVFPQVKKTVVDSWPHIDVNEM